MAQTHDFFATAGDLPLLHTWLNEAGGVPYGYASFADALATDGREIIVQFPAIGPIEFFPSQIDLSQYEENSAQWRQAVFAQIDREASPDRRIVDSGRSATAGLKYPEFRDSQYWVSGSIWFPTVRLRQTFPELSRICQRLEHFLQRFETVLDLRPGKNHNPFGPQICDASILHRVVALPEAYRLLENGECMVEHLSSSRQYRDFRRRLQST